jgi:asparagine synthase (glutamine-hydrolysing)
MCGILGVVYRHGMPASKRQLSVDGIRARGPDNTGHVNYGQVEFFHTRLAVIDRKQASNQPIESEDRQLAVMCNGEIYNYLSLRESSMYPYCTGSDCEAVLDVYSTAGIEGFKQLDGMYAAAIYDARKQVVLLHRDGIGKKPLFWYADENEVIFSSNVHAISSNLRRAPELDLDQVAHYFENGFVHPRHCIYRGIQPVLPGEIIRIDLRSGKIDRSSVGMHDSFDGFDYADSNAVQSQIDSLIEAAVEKRIRGLTSPVIMFSGGIDSMVVATACNGAGNTVLMTLKQPLRWMNDEPFARQEAQRLGQPLVFAYPWRNFQRKVCRSLAQLDQPLSLPSYFITSLLTMEAKRFGNVIITGDGGDEIFFGYRPFGDWVRRCDDPPPRTESVPCGAPFRFSLSDYGIRQSSLDLVGHGFVKVDKATAENQMEARCPLVDRRLVAFVRSIPIEYWQRTASIPKAPLAAYLLGHGMARKSVFRKKVGTAWPFRYRMATSYPWMIRELEGLRDRMRGLGIKVSGKWTPLGVLRNFDLFWKEYVLAKYIERVHRC